MNYLPEIRFSNFCEDWQLSKLEDISDEFSYGVGASATKFDNIKKYIRITDIDDNSRRFIPKPLMSPKGKIEAKYYLKKNDIVFARTGASVGKTYLYNTKDGKLIYAGYLIKTNIKKADASFVFYQTLTNRYLKWIKVNSVRSGQPGINSEELKKYKLYLPSLPEQQKISSFLISVDDKINLLTKKKELLEEYKKGIMQKIFSQEIRFKDDNGNDFPDWEEKKLGEIGEFKTSSVDKLIKKDEQMVSLVNYMNVYNHQSITNETTKDLMQVSANEKQIETTNLKRGDVLFTPSSETPSDIGHSVVIFEDLHNTLYSYHLMRFRPTINLDILYSHYFCNIPSVLRQITRFATGSTRFTISVGSFSKTIIQLPSLKEQKKIALFLSSLDKKIGLVDSQTDKTKEFKKGLLQQMFV